MHHIRICFGNSNSIHSSYITPSLQEIAFCLFWGEGGRFWGKRKWIHPNLISFTLMSWEDVQCQRFSQMTSQTINPSGLELQNSERTGWDRREEDAVRCMSPKKKDETEGTRPSDLQEGTRCKTYVTEEERWEETCKTNQDTWDKKDGTEGTRWDKSYKTEQGGTDELGPTGWW